MEFRVSKKFFESVPNAMFGVVVVKNFNNRESYEFIKKLLTESIAACQKNYENIKVKESGNIIPYREAFNKLGINPNKYMCSIEALITRIGKGNTIPSINPVVDLGNALSIKYTLPVGAHDIDKFDAKGIEIREAIETDEFIPFGSIEVEHPDLGETIYVSGSDVKTRRWTWRQGENSKITEESKNIFFPIDGFSDFNKGNVLLLQKELADILSNNLNLEIKIGVVDKEHPVFTID